jgi:predicted nucleic acid-binding Zn ribbon protein
MERAGEFLGRIARRLDRPEAAFAWLAGAWPSIVGQTLAAHTRPMRCQSGCLEIAVDTKVWKQQLDAVKRVFCERVNCAWGGNLVREVKFLTAKPGPKRISHEADNDHIPFIRRRRG